MHLQTLSNDAMNWMVPSFRGNRCPFKGTAHACTAWIREYMNQWVTFCLWMRAPFSLWHHIDEFQINEINVDLRTSGFAHLTKFSVLTHALYDESVSRSIVYLASVLWLDTESLGFNAEVRGLGQFEIRLYIRSIPHATVQQIWLVKKGVW